MIDWSLYPNFTERELACSHTGKCEVNPESLRKLQELRNRHGRPLTITSAYRDPSHPAERGKVSPGSHTIGQAFDIACSGAQALRILQLALEVGFTRIGVQQKGAARFIHMDDATNLPHPTIWSY